MEASRQNQSHTEILAGLLYAVYTLGAHFAGGHNL